MSSTRVSRVIRLAVMVFGIGFILFGTPKPAAAQIGYDALCGPDLEFECVAVMAPSPSNPSTEIDTYAQTIVDAFGDYIAEADATLTNETSGQQIGHQDATGGGFAEADLNALSISINSKYQLDITHTAIDENLCIPDFSQEPPVCSDPLCCGTILPLASGTMYVITNAPVITSFTPKYGYLGTSGQIIYTGSNFLDPWTGGIGVVFSSGSGITPTDFTITPDGTQLTLYYTISPTATTGARFINLCTTYGCDNGDQTFTVGNAPPIITSVTPAPWVAGTTGLNITILGSGFGTSPGVTVVGTGVTLVSVGTATDSSIAALVTISSGAPNGTATVQVTSNGNGSGFASSYPGEPSTNAYGVAVVGVTAPVPQIQLYGATLTTSSSSPLAAVVGQQIALSATVSLPGGYTMSSQSWQIIQGTEVGGYTNSAGNAPCLHTADCPIPDTTKGQSVALPSNTTASYTFYWVTAGNNPSPVTYSYSATSGTSTISGQATAYFNVDAPTGITLSPITGRQLQTAVSVVPPPNPDDQINPVLKGNIDLVAMASHFPAGGSYQWVQLLGENILKLIAPVSGWQICTQVANTNTPVTLDNSYPYGMMNGHLSPNAVSTTNASTPNDTAHDRPAASLNPLIGEIARSFSAVMYLMYVPPALSNGATPCPSGNICTIPVPLGSFQWVQAGDAINTLDTVFGVISNPYMSWKLNAGTGSSSNQGFASGSTFPTWTTTLVNGSAQNCVPIPH